MYYLLSFIYRLSAISFGAFLFAQLQNLLQAVFLACFFCLIMFLADVASDIYHERL